MMRSKSNQYKSTEDTESLTDCWGWLFFFSSPVSHRSRRPIHPLHVSIQAQTCTTWILFYILNFIQTHFVLYWNYCYCSILKLLLLKQFQVTRPHIILRLILLRYCMSFCFIFCEITSPGALYKYYLVSLCPSLMNWKVTLMVLLVITQVHEQYISCLRGLGYFKSCISVTLADKTVTT